MRVGITHRCVPSDAQNGRVRASPRRPGLSVWHRTFWKAFANGPVRHRLTRLQRERPRAAYACSTALSVVSAAEVQGSIRRLSPCRVGARLPSPKRLFLYRFRPKVMSTWPELGEVVN